ncbi:MAG: arsenate reductase [Oceanicoccus sp.]|jgi:arsenate reductase
MDAQSDRSKVLFLCTGNSCRSQMAEGWLRHLKSSKYEAFSAGIEHHGLDEIAVRVMAEVGVDISHQRSKLFSELMMVPDFIVTVCSNAEKNCPHLAPKTRKAHAIFRDPPTMALELDSDKDILECYRNVRDEIRVFVEDIETCLL